jgi:hypothetical protein
VIDTLQEYLERYEWIFEKIDKDTLLTGFVNAEGFTYPLTISLKEDIVTLMITVQSYGEKLSTANEILLLMLHFNFAWPMVKVGLDESFTIVLAIDLYQIGINYNTFAFALDILTETAQMLTGELREVIKAY